MNNLILLSERPEDIEFFKKISDINKFNLLIVDNLKDFLKLYAVTPSALVAWDADHPNGMDQNHPYSLQSVRFILFKAVPAVKAFAITDLPLNLLPDNPKSSFLVDYPQHNLIRQYNDITLQTYSNFFKGFFNKNLYNFKSFFPEQTKIQEILLTDSTHRLAAVEAINSFLAKSAVEKRLAAKVAQATDELLMNAIFDAPVENGMRVKHLLSRNVQFPLPDGYNVKLEFAITENYCGIAVTDLYGSVECDSIANSLRQNYRKEDYKLKYSTYNAGLGLYSVVQGGISLIICYDQEKMTKAMIFFPNTKSYKAFKNSFQITAVVNNSALKAAL